MESSSPHRSSSDGRKKSYENHFNTLSRQESVAAGDGDTLRQLGYTPMLKQNRSMLTLLFQSFAIAAVPYGVGGPLINAIYGGGQLSLFLGWVITAVMTQTITLSISELASRFPTSAGPYYWSFQCAPANQKQALSFLTGWTWLIANWTITLSVNFGFASLIAAGATMYNPDWVATDWQLVLICYAILFLSLLICALFNDHLPMVDTICAGWTALSIIIILVALSVQAKSGRHSVRQGLGNFDPTLSGWGHFGFTMGLLPAAYTLGAVGMISSMAEECAEPAIKVPQAISLAVPVLGVAGIFFILPICYTLPPLQDIVQAPYGQALPYVFEAVMGSKEGAMGLLFLVLVVSLCCSISLTTVASRCTWAFARDDAIPLSKVWYKVHEKSGVPLNALLLVTLVQALLSLINLGSTSAFTAFISVGVMAVEVSYLIPVLISVLRGRKEVNAARFTCGKFWGPIVNWVAIVWISFQLVIFSMPVTLPVTPVSMNYASVVLMGFVFLSGVWYVLHARKAYQGPPESDGIGLASSE